MKRTAIVLATMFSAALVAGCANWRPHDTSTMGNTTMQRSGPGSSGGTLAPTGATGTTAPNPNPGGAGTSR